MGIPGLSGKISGFGAFPWIVALFNVFFIALSLLTIRPLAIV
ncbi:hypothetical protein [Marininema halotolerans]|uniref:Uncharacterized protein n=1 Tax=Marininema halotolerans TaxID=1155944 RepID=A0A1I6PML7_9BACL|nr:hypothetical protein [Marininema halotolerans]SFS41451.1 hypothetical protein SAMN05444972_10219 [Marininema halotolerans]